MRTLKSVSPFVEGKGISLFLAAFGGCFILVGLFVGGVFERGIGALGSFGFPLQLFLAFGVLMCWGGLSQAKSFARFGKPFATASVDTIPLGEEFEFSYALPVRRDTQIEGIDAFLVLRERVVYTSVEDTTTVDSDRLYQKHNLEGRIYPKRDAIELRTRFRLPTHARERPNPSMHHKDAKMERLWVVKVRVQVAQDTDLWSEFGLEAPLPEKEASLPSPEGFEVVLTEAPLMQTSAIFQAMHLLLPHLRDGQIGDLSRNCPSLLLDEMTQQEAQKAKKLLETAGAKVEVTAMHFNGKGF